MLETSPKASSYTLNKHILDTKVQEFINNNLNSNTTKIALKGSPFSTVTTKELISQIEAKQRCKHKLPTWFHTNNIYYPSKLNIEQTSSELTASYKSKIVKGNTIIDLTGGFGVDSYFFSKQFNKVTYCELNDALAAMAQHNFKELKATINVKHTNGLTYLSNSEAFYDCIYIDPSRRHDRKGKVFLLADCLPNVPENLDVLFKHTNTIMIKTAPLLDITAGSKELHHVKDIYIVAVNNEVKELLWVLEKNHTPPYTLKAINITKTENAEFSFTVAEEHQATVAYGLPETYLYEPNAAILKSGGFKMVAQANNLSKLEQHTHLYTASHLIKFPGRVFKIKSVQAYNHKFIKEKAFKKANITTRNFPESVAQIRKRCKITDGGDTYLFFTTTLDHQKIVIACNKLQESEL